MSQLQSIESIKKVFLSPSQYPMYWANYIHCPLQMSKPRSILDVCSSCRFSRRGGSYETLSTNRARRCPADHHRLGNPLLQPQPYYKTYNRGPKHRFAEPANTTGQCPPCDFWRQLQHERPANRVAVGIYCPKNPAAG